MSDQSIFHPDSTKHNGLMIECPKHAERLAHVQKTNDDIQVRFPLQMQRDYQTAFFQAAAQGDINILNALTHKDNETHGLVDSQTCDNALWVSVAEQHHQFALQLLNLPEVRKKITHEGAQAAIDIALEEEKKHCQNQKAVISALLNFISQPHDAMASKEHSNRTRKAKKNQNTGSLSRHIKINFDQLEPAIFNSQVNQRVQLEDTEL